MRERRKRTTQRERGKSLLAHIKEVGPYLIDHHMIWVKSLQSFRTVQHLPYQSSQFVSV